MARSWNDSSRGEVANDGFSGSGEGVLRLRMGRGQGQYVGGIACRGEEEAGVGGEESGQRRRALVLS